MESGPTRPEVSAEHQRRDQQQTRRTLAKPKKLSSSALRLDEREKDTETRDQHWVRHQCTNRLSSSALRLDETREGH